MKKKNTIGKVLITICVCICIPLFTSNSFGQISQGGIPYSLQFHTEKGNDECWHSLEEIPTFEMALIKQSIIEELKENNSKKQDVYQFAYSFNVKIDVKESATKDSIDCGILYRLAIKSSGAYSVNIIFSEYHVPDGAKLFIYNETCDYVIGAFTSNNNKKDNIFAVSPVIGEKIIIEYFEPYFSDFDGSLIIGRVSHDFLDILNSGKKSEFRAAGNCEVDINCSEGNDWQKEKRAVCKISINGDYFCSGALINNTNNDGHPYFLTANHCISTQQEASSSLFYFNYEKPGCNSGNGSLSQSISGATLLATGYNSDFTLLELSKVPPSTFRPYFAGWDRNNAQSAGGVGIHHPGGDVKKISTYSIVPQTSYCFTDRPSSNFYRINWISTVNGYGVTEGGSSGSPLFNVQKRIIGQLYGSAHCSNTNCSNPSNDISNYGKIYSSWNLGTTSSERLRDWLDPSNSIYTLDGLDACPIGTAVNLNLNNTIASGTYLATNNIESTGIIQSNSYVVFNAGNSIALNPGFRTQTGSDFQAKIEDFNCVIVPSPINLVAWTNVACTETGLQFNIANATNYTVRINSISGQLIYRGSGSITSNIVTVWSATGVNIGYYIATISFSSSSSGEVISNSYTILVTDCSKKSFAVKDEDEEIISIQESDDDYLVFTVQPNPNKGDFTLQLLNVKDMRPYVVEFFNSSGILINKIEHCNTSQLNFNYADLPQGVYFVKLTMGIKSATKKVIIK
ncbi:MAG: T9SS type A sorting domain-containing protein [Salinivirgaceae bacterium]|nr:T9SS type A sorting domain-containing protein [Salinivirgaceae bacterium]